MKNLLLVVALTVAAAPAMASKARLNALGNSAQLVDVQTTFDRPQHMHFLGDLVTIEWGDKGATAPAPHAEGGFLKKHNDAVYGIYFGRKSTEFSDAVTKAVGYGFSVLDEQNPINLMYGMKSGDLSWGASVKYSNGKSDGATTAATDDQSVKSAGASFGITDGTWDANITLGLIGETKLGDAELKSKGNIKVGFGYNLSDSMYTYGKYNTYKSEGEAPGNLTADIEKSAIEVGFINTVSKTEDANFFYGVAYSTTTDKEKHNIGAGKDSKTETSFLPVWMGIEANATSWMVLRASVVQNVLLNETKTGDLKNDVDSIGFNAGAGLKLGKGMLDANFGTAKAGQLSFSNGSAAGQEFLTNVAYTYLF